MFFDRERCEVLGEFVIDNGATVRATAKNYGISKSTVHKDLAYKLKIVNPKLYLMVKEVLDLNKSERHLRGGEATKRKYMKKAEKSSSLF